MGSAVRIHWDRVFVLLAVVTALIVVAGHALVRAVAPDPPEDGGSASSAPPVAPVAAPEGSPCPEPQAEVLRTAPRSAGERTVALTFDDGPGPWTDDVLAVLAAEDVKATFFVVGREAAADPDRVRAMRDAGHAVENHSWSHPSAGRSGRWNRELIGKQILRTSAAITDVLGQPPCFFRPPQGVVPGAEKAAEAAGLTIALWSVDPRDWAAGTGSKAAATIRARAKAGLQETNPVVLLHDGGGDRRATVAALPGIIADYRSAGFAFVTLAETGG